MRLAIAADHNGTALKAHLAAWLAARGHDVDDLGTNGAETVDYPYLCAEIGALVTDGDARRGIVIGGTGSGEQIACNKIHGVRASATTCSRLRSPAPTTTPTSWSWGR